MYISIGKYKVDLYYKDKLIDSVVYLAGSSDQFLMLEVLNKHFPHEYNPIEARNLLGEDVPVDKGYSYVTKVLDSTGKLIYDCFKFIYERIDFPDGHVTYTEIEAPPEIKMKPMPRAPRLGKI